MKTENYFSKHSAVVQLISEAELHHQHSLLFWQKIQELEKTIASDFDFFPDGMVNGLIESVACSAFYYGMAIDRLGQIRKKYQRSKKHLISDDDPEYTNDGDHDYLDNDLIDEIKSDDHPLKESAVNAHKICYIDARDMPYNKMLETLKTIGEQLKAQKVNQL